MPKTIKVKGNKFLKEGKKYKCKLHKIGVGKKGKRLDCASLSGLGRLLERNITEIEIDEKTYLCDLVEMHHGGKRLYCTRLERALKTKATLPAKYEKLKRKPPETKELPKARKEVIEELDHMAQLDAGGFPYDGDWDEVLDWAWNQGASGGALPFRQDVKVALNRKLTDKQWDEFTDTYGGGIEEMQRKPKAKPKPKVKESYLPEILRPLGKQARKHKNVDDFIKATYRLIDSLKPRTRMPLTPNIPREDFSRVTVARPTSKRGKSITLEIWQEDGVKSVAFGKREIKKYLRDFYKKAVSTPVAPPPETLFGIIPPELRPAKYSKRWVRRVLKRTQKGRFSTEPYRLAFTATITGLQGLAAHRDKLYAFGKQLPDDISKENYIDLLFEKFGSRPETEKNNVPD